MRLLLLSLLVTSCNQLERHYYTTQKVEKEVKTKTTADNEERLAFSGYFNLDGGSDANCIYLDEKVEGLVDIENDCQSLVSVNLENDTLGQFPTISASNLVVINNEIRYTRNLNYSSGNDLEEDVNSDNITGSRCTDIFMKFVDSRLQITLKIYENSNNNNLNSVVATRVFNEL